MKSFLAQAVDTLPELPLGPQTGAQLMAIIDTITNWIFAGFAVFAVIMTILAALQFVKDGGTPLKVAEARSKLIWAAIGIGVALLSRGFVPVMRSIMGA